MEYSDAVGQVLLVFLVLSVVFEAALTPIFNWRLFIRKLGGTGVKTPITIILALLIFWKYDLDIINDLLIALDQISDDSPITFWGQVITAFLIAGGSDGIFRIFKRLKIRAPEERKAEVLRQEEEKLLSPEA